MKIFIVDSFHVTCDNTPSAERSLDGQSLKVLQRKLNCGVLWKLSMEIIWMLLEYLRWIKLAFPCPNTKLRYQLVELNYRAVQNVGSLGFTDFAKWTKCAK
jgi:hypothetical protein